MPIIVSSICIYVAFHYYRLKNVLNKTAKGCWRSITKSTSIQNVYEFLHTRRKSFADWTFWSILKILGVSVFCRTKIIIVSHCLLIYQKKLLSSPFKIFPLYEILGCRDGMQQKLKHSPVVIARIVFILLGCLMFCTLIYTLVTDGSPFRKELLYP